MEWFAVVHVVGTPARTAHSRATPPRVHVLPSSSVSAERRGGHRGRPQQRMAPASAAATWDPRPRLANGPKGRESAPTPDTDFASGGDVRRPEAPWEASGSPANPPPPPGANPAEPTTTAIAGPRRGRLLIPAPGSIRSGPRRPNSTYLPPRGHSVLVKQSLRGRVGCGEVAGRFAKRVSVADSRSRTASALRVDGRALRSSLTGIRENVALGAVSVTTWKTLTRPCAPRISEGQVRSTMAIPPGRTSKWQIQRPASLRIGSLLVAVAMSTRLTSRSGSVRSAKYSGRARHVRHVTVSLCGSGGGVVERRHGGRRS